MNKDILQNLLKFLDRVELKGSEVPAFITVMNELSKLSKENTWWNEKKD